MKTTFTLICFYAALLCYVNSSAQQVTYQKSYEFEIDHHVEQLLQLPGKGSLMIGWQPVVCRGGSNCKPYIFCLRFDERGNAIWSKNYYTNISFSSPKATITADGGFLFLGKLYDKTKSEYKGALLVKCNKNGNVIWSKRISSKNYSALSPQLIYENKKKEILILYALANDMYYSELFQILKLDKNGNLLWFKSIDTKPFYSIDIYTANSIIQTGNEIFIGGDINCQPCEGVVTANIIHLSSNDGSVISFKELRARPLNYNNNTSIIDFFIADNKLLAFGGFGIGIGYNWFVYPINDSTTSESAALIKPDLFALQRYLKAHKTLLPLQFASSAYFKKDLSLVDFYTYDQLDKINLNQYDSLGRICPEFSIPKIHLSMPDKKFSLNTKVYSIISDSVYISNGIVHDSSFTLMQTLICEDSANTQSNSKEKISNVNTDKNISTIFPNPVENVLYVQHLQSGKNILTIINSVGVVLNRTTTYSSNEKITVEHLPGGIYYLNIRGDKQNKTYRFIKK